MEFMQDAFYSQRARGDSSSAHVVVYAPPSMGKTTACVAFMEKVAPQEKSPSVDD